MNLRWWRMGAILASLAVAGLGALSARASSFEGRFERTLKVTGLAHLDVVTGSGDITVRSGNSGSVQVTGTIRANTGWSGNEEDVEKRVRYLEQNPPIEQSGSIIRIGHLDDSELQRNISISYDLVVPRESELRSRTGSGSQTIESIQGPADAGAGSGSIRISNVGDEVRASTGSGNIEVESVKGRLSARAGSGSIRASGIAGGSNVETGSGEVELEEAAPGDVEVTTGSGTVRVHGVRGSLRVRTGSGNITAEGDLVRDWRLHGASGSVSVKLPAQAAFDLRAHTSSGSIRTEHPVTAVGTIGRRELNGKVNGGGPLLDISTASGNIDIE